MDYIKDNKAAWEEAFDNRLQGWGDDNHIRLQNEWLPFLHPDIVSVVEGMDFRGKDIAQFCCNNGRELMSLMQLGAASGTGFDIAENILDQARLTAEKAGVDCCFVCGDLMELGKEYHGRFDFILFTIGAITWLKDLDALFVLVAACLKPSGQLMIHDFHSFMNMLATPGEEAFDSSALDKIAYPYFTDEPFDEDCAAGYITGDYHTKSRFTSFAHTMSAIIGGIIRAGLDIVMFDEFSHDVGLTEAYDNMGYPLSYLLLAEKRINR